MSGTRAFISHTNADKPAAEKLARELRAKGVDAWLDKWEIAPGDSLIEKIFDDGLKECSVFIILLSAGSVASKWVKYELDVALIRRIEEKTRVVPILLSACEIPEALKVVRRLDATQGIEHVIGELVAVAHGRWDNNRPPLRQPAALERAPIGRYSDFAWAIARKLLPLLLETGRPGWSTSDRFAAGLDITAQQFEDALAELEDDGVIEINRYYGGNKYDIGAVHPTCKLALRAAEAGVLDFDPVADLRAVMVAIAVADALSPEELLKQTSLSPARMCIAVDIVKLLGLAQVAACTSEYGFIQINATSDTRRWVRTNAS